MSWVSDFVKSFSNEKGGFSGRKLSAAVALLAACYIACLKLPEGDRIYAVYAFLIFSLLCLGLVTVPDLIKFLSSRGGVIKETSTTEKTEIKTEVVNESN